MKELAALIIATSLLFLPWQAPAYQVYTVQPPISNHAIFLDGPLPTTCKPDLRWEIVAARGTTEPVSLLVESEQPLQQVRIQITPLTGPTALPRGSVEPFLLQRLPVSVSMGNVAIPWLLVRDSEMLELQNQPSTWVTELTAEWTGPAWDPVPMAEYQAAFGWRSMLRKPLRDASCLRPVDVKGRDQFWLNVTIPDDAPSGVYQSQVVVRPANAAPTTLELTVRVPAFDLEPAPFTYSVYHPTDHIDPPLTDTQLLNDFRLMRQYGLLNPNLYAGPQQDETGQIHFERLNRYLDLREQAGLPKGDLFVFDGAGMIISDRPLTPEEEARNTEVAAATVAWARERGYGQVYFMGCDEYSGDRLTAQRQSWEAVIAGGAGIYVAGYDDLEERVGDLLGVMVIMHPDALVADTAQWTMTSEEALRGNPNYWKPETMLTEFYQSVIAKQHERGFRVFTYMDPTGGNAWPDDHRRHRGLGMWLIGLDGTMTWAWTHYRRPAVTALDEEAGGCGHAFIMRGPESVLPALSLEAFRAGHNDARYVATLETLIAQGGVGAVEAQTWLNAVESDIDLTEWRTGLIHWIEQLTGG